MTTDLLLSQAVDRYLLARRREVADTTFQRYRYVFRLLIEAIGDMPLAQLDDHQLVLFREWLHERDYAVASINSFIRSLRAFGNWLVERDHLKASPVRFLRTTKEKLDDPRAIRFDDFLAMLGTAVDQRKRREVAIMLFLLGTGCRLAGLRYLRLSDLDLDNRRAQVTEKGNKTRWVYLDDTAASALLDYIHHERPLTASEYVFVSRNGTAPLAPTVIRWNLDEIAKAAGVQGPHNPHSFRHAFSVMALESGANLAAVSRLLGHSNIAITGMYYARFESSTLKAIHQEHNPLRQLTLLNRES